VRIGFCDPIAGDESWIFLNTGPSPTWNREEETIPNKPKLIIASQKAMLTVILGITSIVFIN
jgi:hypothetical protein